MHDCSMATGDSFLRVLVPQILNSASYQSGNTLLIINTDEDLVLLIWRGYIPLRNGPHDVVSIQIRAEGVPETLAVR